VSGKERLKKIIDERLPLDSAMRAAVEEGIARMSDAEAAREADRLEVATSSLCADVAAMEEALDQHDTLIAKLAPKV
jgi:hypothetical protein